MMIRILHYSPRSALDINFPVEKLDSALRSKKGLLWVDFSGEPNESCEPILREVFGFHPLAVDDALQETHTPKVDDWGDYVYIVLNSLDYDEELTDKSLHTDELDIFLGKNYVVTHHDKPIIALDQVWTACQRDVRHTQDGADHLLYKIVDFIVAGYMPIVTKLDDEIDDIEDQVFNKPTRETLEQIFALKRALLSMRRVITPQREVLNKLARDDYRIIDPHDRIFFRDVYDHLVRLQDLNESMRDLVGGVLDTYLSVINNRMNDVMKTLTVITTLFMPISFVAGFFGMNFFEPTAHLVEWTSNPAFIVMLTITILLPVSMFVWMRSRTWV
jgi:magnesium transporter